MFSEQKEGFDDMNKKSLVLSAFNMQPTPVFPVTPHWWGVYKFQHAGVISGQADEQKGWQLSGAALAEVDIKFFESFGPDIFHLSAGAWKAQPGDAERHRAYTELCPAAMALDNKRAIDEYVKFTTPSREDYISSGIYGHVGIINQRYGDDVLILINEGNPADGILMGDYNLAGNNNTLFSIVDHPDNFAYFMYKIYEAQLPRIRVIKESGAHGYIGSECCISCDILAPSTFRDLIAPALRMFYNALKQIEMSSVAYFTGEILPIIDDIAGLGANALMIEEEKKNYHLDAVEIYRRLNGRMALFGNLDSVYHLLLGSPGDVERETIRQCEGASGGGFIAACGSPLCFDTPEANIRAMLDTARNMPV